MNYKVLIEFRDKNENANDHIYKPGDVYPFDKYTGAKTNDRIAELTDVEYFADDETTKGPFIEAIADEE